MKHVSHLAVVLVLSLVFQTISISIASAHMILRAEGKVRLKKENSSAYNLTGTGDILESGDVLEPQQEATVIVFCDDVATWRVPSGVASGVSAGCEKGVRALRGKRESRLGGSDPGIPYTIAPRLTYVLNSQPTLRWNRVPGATEYTVRVFDAENTTMWGVTVKADNVKYPPNALGLKWGVPYMLSVKADNGASSLNDAGACMGFKLMSPEKMQQIRDASARITHLSQLKPDEIALANAYVYDKSDLISEAIETLEPLVTQGSRNPLPYFQLARLYAISGLNRLAEARGAKALELYRVAEDKYGMARAEAELAGVKMMLGNKAEARSHADQARLFYQAIENAQGALQVEQRMRKAEDTLAAAVIKPESERGCAANIEAPSPRN